MAELDVWEIKTRIADIVKDNASVFSATPSDKTKLRKFEVGRPPGGIEKITVLPSGFVTNANPLRVIRPSGTVRSNAWKSLTEDVRFSIVFAADGKDSQKVEETLDDFEKLILDTFETNNQLTNPTTGLDPKVDTSWPERTIPFVVQNGDKSVQGREIILHCIATVGQ